LGYFDGESSAIAIELNGKQVYAVWAYSPQMRKRPRKFTFSHMGQKNKP
jgi:hypothetical protein